MDIFSEKDETNENRYGCNPLVLALFGILKIEVKPYLGGSEQGTQKIPRDLTTYAILLRFDPRYLNDKEVLNFGCGDDRFFMREMKKMGIQPKRLVRLDVNRELKRIVGKEIIIYDGINFPRSLKKK